MDHLPEMHFLSVFTVDAQGGNPTVIVPDAAAMSATDMQEIARTFGHESGFVVPPADDSGCDFALRFWVPNHEMEMCGHATVGAVWLLNHLGCLSARDVSIATRSGNVHARVVAQGPEGPLVEITQPVARIEALPGGARNHAEILSVLGITQAEMADLPIQNACTSRVKTLVPLRSPTILDGLEPDFGRVRRLCEAIGSTGLYPYALSQAEHQIVDARQFPQSSGYPEDPATGIAASALAFGLLENGLVERSERPVRVHQGRAMGRSSEIVVRFQMGADGTLTHCWLGGQTVTTAAPAAVRHT